MRRAIAVPVSWLALGLCVPLAAQDSGSTGIKEQVQVTLVQIDALVTDDNGRTVPDLTKNDFSLAISGTPVEVSDVDLLCPGGATADPAPAKKGETQPPPKIAPGVKRRIVFAFDYAFLDFALRASLLDAVERMLRNSKTDEEEVMLVALTSEVRVEQKFTSDPKPLIAALSRMKQDVTLWPREFHVDSVGREYFDHLAVLMDVLADYDGSKAVVFFSQAESVGPAMRNHYYDLVAAHAAAAHAAIYPARPDLRRTIGPGDTLMRLAEKTGGRVQTFGSDLSIEYRRAQRDLSCRYLIAARVNQAATRAPQSLAVKLKNPSLTIRTPEMFQLFTDEARQDARAQAAYVDPSPYERPLVRAFAFSAVPTGVNKWDTLLAVSIPAAPGGDETGFDVNAVVRRNGQIAGSYKTRVEFDPPGEPAVPHLVTVLGTTKLTDGQYDLTVVLKGRSGGEIVGAETGFVVPEVPEDLLMLRGPIMGREVADRQFFGADSKHRPEPAGLGKILAPDSGFEPLLVEEIDKDSKLLFYWSACVSGTNPVPGDAVVARSVVTADGDTIRQLDPVRLQLASRREGIGCMDMLDTLAPNTLAAGDYRLEVTVMRRNGDVIARGTEPLTVR
jgi:VWFA-related protein